ncbi:NmrA family protein [Xylariaceae sp. FL1272]|nr:NmrA family protein [Xylariaceae sp. FL1272]
MSSPRLISVIGGTGAQGIPIVKALVESGDYTVRALTRDTSNARFKELQSFGPVEGLVGSFASEQNLRTLFKGSWGAFVNIDGFNAGEMVELYWTIRAWELAIEEGVKFFVLGHLDYAYKLSDFKIHAGHYDAKGRAGAFILSQNADPTVSSRMRSALFTTGPYIEMTLSALTPLSPTLEDGVATWRVPLASGAVPFTALADCGVYVKHLFDHPDESSGVELASAISHVTMSEYVEAFQKVTGKPAKWIDVPLNDDHLTRMFGPLADTPAGYNAASGSMSVRENFTAFYEIFRASGGNKGVLRRDYGVLDKVHPGRIRSVEEWLRREDQEGREKGLGGLWERLGNLRPVLKMAEDGRTGSI